MAFIPTTQSCNWSRELGFRSEPSLGPQSDRAFNEGRCSGERSYSVTGAMLDYADQRDEWKFNPTAHFLDPLSI